MLALRQTGSSHSDNVFVFDWRLDWESGIWGSRSQTGWHLSWSTSGFGSERSPHMCFSSGRHAAGSTLACKKTSTPSPPHHPLSTCGILLDASPAGSTWPTYSFSLHRFLLFLVHFLPWLASGCCNIHRRPMLRLELGTLCSVPPQNFTRNIVSLS